MSAFAAERLKLTTTRGTLALLGALLGVVTVAMFVHVASFEKQFVDELADQRAILTDVGVTMGLVFAAISGSNAITGEFRHGTIRPTLLKHSDRGSLFLAKLVTQLFIGAGLAMAATAFAVGLAAVILSARGLSLELGAEQVARLIGGAALGGAGFATLGLAIGTVVRNQVPVVVGVLVWTLFIEGLMRAGIPSVAQFGPASLVQAVAATDTGGLDSPIVAALVLLALAAVGAVASRSVFLRRDIA